MRDGRGIAVYDQGILTEWYGNLFFHEKPIRFVLMKEKISILTIIFSAFHKRRTEQKARYEEKILNDKRCGWN